MRLGITYIFLLSFIFIFPQQGLIEFTECRKIKKEEDKVTCNQQMLLNYIGENFNSSHEANYSQEKTIIRYTISAQGDFTFSIVNKNELTESLNKKLSDIMEQLKSDINSGHINIIPAQQNGRNITSSYLLPIILKVPVISTEKKMIMVTYKTPEKTIQFRRDLNGVIYAYSINDPNEEKLLVTIDNKVSPASFSDNEKFYFFLYNLTFVKPAILLTSGILKGQHYDIYIDKDNSPENNNQIIINVYLSDTQHIVDTFPDINQLILSKYSDLLFK